MAPTESVGATESNDGLIVEAHAVKYFPQVLAIFLDRPVVRVRQAVVRRDVLRVHGIHAARLPGDIRTAENLYGDDACERIEVGVAHVGVRLLHWLELSDHLVEPGVGAMGELFLEAYGSLLRAAGLRHLVVGATGMPSEAHHRGPEVRVCLHHFFYVSPGRRKNLGRNLRGGPRRRRDNDANAAGCHDEQTSAAAHLDIKLAVARSSGNACARAASRPLSPELRCGESEGR
mmetsp:Transcript_59045/g.164977  ORF Transcript_59045/g.164977 Transcript_59045/m.164977 type:complete len:232 (+) Transcript_59045:666-1361(+)